MLRRFAVGMVLFAWSCGTSNAPDPFIVDGGAEDGASNAQSEASFEASVNGTVGGPCLEDGQCDDGVDCTFDSCDIKVHRCEFLADDARCQDGTFCNGVEICDPVLGCRLGPVKDCNDGHTCTIDSCVEATQGCDHALRDADGDGVPDGHCMPSGDCDDTDPTVYPGHVEVCANRKDDDCDGTPDESDCQKPSHDTCIDPLTIDHTGNYELDTTAASFDYPGSCAPMDPATRRDVVAALVLAGDPRDIDIVAEAPRGDLALGVGAECGKLATEIACASGANGPGNDRIARVRLRSLAAATYPLYVWLDRDDRIVLHVTYGPPTQPPANETCALAEPLQSGKPVTASLPGATRDLTSRCGFASGDLVYSIVVDDTSDIAAYATSLDGYGVPVVSLRRANCSTAEDEIACNAGEQAKAFARALPKGTYDIAVSANAPTDVKLEVDVSPPTQAPADETCVGAPVLTPNHTIDVSLQGHTDDVAEKCGAHGSIDAAYALDLAARSDVLLVLRIAEGDTGNVSLLGASCDLQTNQVCASGATSPVRATLRGVPAGSYRVVAESALGDDIQLTAFVRAAVPPTLVPFGDKCSSPATIAETGGFYQGNTANAAADFTAGCDVTGGGEFGAPDQMLAFHLSSKKRVIFDMQGTAYASILDVRRGDTCPGTEVPQGCSAGYGNSRSYLDLTLEPGKYWVQVDGYGGQSGPWFLDVRVVEP
jgi:Putative metal-binding motif